MKYSAKYLSTGLLMVSFAMAQGNVPECGNSCIQRMEGKAQELGCTDGDTACLCRNPDFYYGIRDCSFESCLNEGDAELAAARGREICSSAGVAITQAPVATATQATGTETVIATPIVSSIFSVITSGGSAFSTLIGETTIAPSVGGGNSETVAPTPVSTSTFTTVITSGESTITSVGETTLLGVGGTPGATGAPNSSVVTTGVVSTITSGGNIGQTTLLTDATESASATEASETPSATESQSPTETTGEATSASSTGLAPKQTAGVAAGILAGVGLAAMLI
ncbi:hypothetical protein CkaCkLH20_11976 [Colletotrichum karsti]|uniref:CFEM domain-containing protein n=1 Tax=Colletotrichum karsti TaxID=1095194 RepID=A0A9P6HY59_9PEZI|nr:uncharacterized protein CkaCkLH20_11976 [Colletotrichum karsti]KAF9870486.1 hypothetical protein CkaCkLH20_11976 [Colletotrichum karsti]